MADRRLLLVHALAPPRQGGTPIVLRRLLGALEGWRLDVITDLALRGQVRRRSAPLLDGRYRYFARLGGRGLVPRVLQPLVNTLDALLAVVAGLRVAWAARRADVVLSVFDDGFSPVAGAIGARLARKPHVVMVFDLWQENAYPIVPRLIARIAEGPIMRSAAARVVYCETAADLYREKHGVECDVIATPIEIGEQTPPSPPRGPAEVLVAGAIYWAQEDAVRRLLRAAATVPEASVTIVGDERSLRARGFDADRFEAEMPADTFRRRLDSADVLFVGLAFESRYPDIVRTATPARLAEYMASGRPLLIHAPEGSHAAEYVRGGGLGEVVDVPDDAALAQGLRAVVGDPERARERARRARGIAVERHAVGSVAAAFRDVLDGLR